MSKPVVFISHLHEDEGCANALELALKKALLGALDVFNSSNRRSISVGDPWRDRIIEALKQSATVLVLASPDSVASPWVNFEAGGAWVTGTRVIPLCIRGMKPESLPAPLSHLQAISLDSPDDLRLLIKSLAQTANLDEPTSYDYDIAARNILETWLTQVSAGQNDNTSFLSWFDKTSLRPEKYKGERAIGLFRVRDLSSTNEQAMKQFRDEKMKAGDTINFRIDLDSDTTYRRINCYASGETADFIERADQKRLLRGTVKAIGQLKVFETHFDFGDEDRGVSYATCWRVTDIEYA